ncbi:uncharacterized protein LOC128547795 [Mercenaria mercenaria]|uniref:uncharacterized protein LOC128547795 n=1 Tax=Mercenaria mercenaria TaxID=6596 RepID=UPI00234F2E9D|nr:uncharacterized protein LOC128547795 [Mercenaria mercenaria]
MLADTGSNVTILRRELYENMAPLAKPNLIPINMSLTTATGDTAPFHGMIRAEIFIGSQSFDHMVYLADIKSDSILGMDFFKSHKCQIDVSRKSLKLNEEEIPCYHRDVSESFTSCRIQIKENTVIPPETEVIVLGKPTGVVSETIGIVEPNINFIEKSGLLVAKALVDIRKGDFPNPSGKLKQEPYTVYKNTNAAFFEAEQGERVKILLIKHQNVFSKSSDDIGRTHTVEHTIETGSARPVKQAPYRVPLAKRLAAEKEIKEWLRRA